MNQTIEPTTVNNTWQRFYRLSAMACWTIAILLVGEIIVYAFLPRTGTVIEHFRLFQDNPLAGLLTLDLLGMIAYLLFIPVILSLFVTLRRVNEPVMAFATVLFFVGITDFFATNTAFSVLSLSKQYAAATTDEERAMFLAAGQMMFTLFNENAFLVSYVIVSASWMMISCIMLYSNRFSRATAFSGIVAGAAAIIAVILEHISAAPLATAIFFYFAAIVFLFIWVILLAQRLYRLGSSAGKITPEFRTGEG